MEVASLVVTMLQCVCGQCCSSASISEQCNYLRKPQAVVQIIEDKIKLLTARETDVRTSLQYEKIWRGMDPTAELNLWLDNVQQISAALASLVLNIQENMSCLWGCFPNYYYRLTLGNYVATKMLEADKLLDQSNFRGSSLVNMTTFLKGKTLPTNGLIGETAKIILVRTWNFLVDTNTMVVGIYGMGGVGKTTIIKEINNKFLRENTHFDEVIWVTASKNSDMQRIQKNIARAIGLCFDYEDSDMMRASTLFEALLRRGRFLLIIDDMWEAFSLEDIGIPKPTGVNGCKLLITTRSLSVCRSMETCADIEVRVLSDEEAWDLFKQKVGEEVLLSPSIWELARRVANECGGLPLALITIGRALRKENNVKHWQTALSELANSTISMGGMDNLVFARLRFSYDRLKDDMTRACFAYCALYPEDHLIETEELLKYWLWEGLLDTCGNQVAKMKHGEMILHELKSVCMLESVYQDGSILEVYVKMHDLIRDMVIALTRENTSFMVKSGRGLQVQPQENEWSPNLERVSLMRNDLGCLSSAPNCPKLCTLLLQYNSISKGAGLHSTFFDHLQNLKVLDLSYTGIFWLPESLSNLEKLHALLLCSCWNLNYVPTLAQLKKLRVLDLSYTSSIHSMPQGMEMLLNLQNLNLSYCNASEIQVFLLPNYKFLESLFLIGERQFIIGPTFVDALSSCISLVSLEVNFSSMQDFDQYIKSGHWSLLENFKIFIGYPPSSTHIGKNSVAFFGVDIYERLSPAWLPGRILELEIHECSSITQLPEFISAAASQLQRCKLRYCDLMECLIVPEWSTFPNLERVEIEDLDKLSGICKGIVPRGTLAGLKVLHVRACNELKILLPLELAHNLRNLEEINVENCEQITEVIGTGETDEVIETTVVLPMLKRIQLSGLPELKHLYKGTMICDFLSNVEVYRCSELKMLPFFVEIREQLFSSLKQIKGSKSWWKTLRRNHGNVINRLQPFFKQVPENLSVPADSDDNSLCSVGSENSSIGPR